MGKYYFKSRAPFLQCPKCKCRAFGVLNVGGVHFVRRCNSCDFSQTFKLPKPNKKLVYIDQYAISFDVKEKIGRAHKKWPAVKRALKHALHMDAIACPYSEFHEGESSLEKNLAKELKDTYKRFAQGEMFQPTVCIEMAQIARALKQFVGKPEETKSVKWRDVLQRDPHVWTSDIYFTFNTETAREVEATARKVKTQISARLDDLNNNFKASKKSFKEQYLLEAQQVGVNMLKMYTNDIAKLMVCKTPGAADALHNINKEELSAAQAGEEAAQNLRDKIDSLTKNMNALLDMILSGMITQDEYAQKKRSCIEEKKECEMKLAAFEREGSKRFEPLIGFYKTAVHAGESAVTGNPEENLQILAV